jgi:hypothetical protein
MQKPLKMLAFLRQVEVLGSLLSALNSAGIIFTKNIFFD